MSKNLRVVIGIVIVIAVVSAGAFLYLTRPLDDPSEDIQENTQQLDNGTEGESTVFRISQEESTVEFNINEVLNGADKTVIGMTNEVAGDILVNMSNPSNSQVGQIRINARTFETDNQRRDAAIGRMILQAESAEYEFIEFVPTSISGMPESINVGDTIEFQVTGDLTVKGTTREVTFDATATYTSADQITGSAETLILYPDFDLSIPSVPQVASVEDEVILKINFVANAVEIA